MQNRRQKWFVLGFLVLFVAGIAASALRNLDESSRRSLQLKDNIDVADSALISVVVTTVDPTAKEFTASISLQPKGNLAEDRVTPKADLKLFMNNINGTQEFDFPKGKRINRVEATFNIQGDVNKYPLDRYVSSIWLLVDTSRKASLPIAASQTPSTEDDETSESDVLTVTKGALPVPLSVALSASIPGMKFEGNASRPTDSKFVTIDLRLRRPDNVIIVSFFVSIIMMGLALSIFAMVLRAMTSPTRGDLIPLSVSISLIFGLPALRNIQPGVPPVGVLGDHLSFLWAEMTVAASAILAMWTLLARYLNPTSSRP
jgi:hypothetical protein